MDIWHFLDSLYRARARPHAQVQIQEVERMPSNFSRVVTTGIIWFGVALLAGVMKGSVSGFNAVFMAIVMAIAAAWATRSVWTSGLTVVQQQAEADEKSKRSGSVRVRKLVDALSDSELDELRERLILRDEDPVPLESLMARRARND